MISFLLIHITCSSQRRLASMTVESCPGRHRPLPFQGKRTIMKTGRTGAVAALLLMLVAAACSQGSEPVASVEPETPVIVTAEMVEGSAIFIRIFKAEAELEAWGKAPAGERFSLVRTFPICTFSGVLGPKLREGDRQSPEGFYRVRKGSLNPNSSYHLSFNLGFPNAYDRAHGRTGSYLMVHGNCVSIGCYAMTDAGIETIYGMVETALDAGQDAVSVHIFPFRMSAENMAAYGRHEWIDYWRNLKTGHDMFETTKKVPGVRVEGLDYAFTSG